MFGKKRSDKVVPLEVSPQGKYSIKVEGMKVNGKTVETRLGKAQLDSASTLTYLPALAEKLVRKAIEEHYKRIAVDSHRAQVVTRQEEVAGVGKVFRNFQCWLGNCKEWRSSGCQANIFFVKMALGFATPLDQLKFCQTGRMLFWELPG